MPSFTNMSIPNGLLSQGLFGVPSTGGMQNIKKAPSFMDGMGDKLPGLLAQAAKATEPSAEQQPTAPPISQFHMPAGGVQTAAGPQGRLGFDGVLQKYLAMMGGSQGQPLAQMAGGLNRRG
ncbi:MAG: hypothetical protein ABFE08_09055 [Armatimonadia bacterium]